MQKNLRILFNGERWLGSNAASSFRALRRQGHLVHDEDINYYFPISWSSLMLRAARKALRPAMVREFNDLLIHLAHDFKPHIFIAFKGEFILPETLRKIKGLGIGLYVYYPDIWVFNRNTPWLPQSLQQYDCVFSTKKFTDADMKKRGTPLRNYVYLPHGYDPDLHRPSPISPEDAAIYGSDLTFIGAFSPGKMALLTQLKGLMPALNLGIWGNAEWGVVPGPELRNSFKGRWLPGDEYVFGLCASKIALALLLEKSYGASSGDEITSRTFNIPATGTFMIHQRTDEVQDFFKEGKEIECFDGADELAAKIKFYLAHPEKRQAIAQAGYRRCVPAYSHDNRMKVILDWHEKHRP